MKSIKAGLLFHRIKKILDYLGDLILFFLMFSRIKYLCRQSILWPSGNDIKQNEACHICKNGKVETLIKSPVGYPIRQNHISLYYDYDVVDMGPILGSGDILNRTAGFFLSVTWNFCERCRNASIGVDFPEGHVDKYYASYYRRIAQSSQARKNTKEIHARYLDKFLKSGSNILELGAAEGYAANYLSRRGHNVYIFEPSEQYHKILTEEKLLHPIGDINKLSNNSFDCIYLHHVLEHIPSPLEYLRFLFILLKPGGMLFIQVPDLSLQLRLYSRSLRFCHYSIFNRYVINFPSYFRSLKKSNIYYWLEALNNDHLSGFTPEGLVFILEKIGFDIQVLTQTTSERLLSDNKLYAWPIDYENGNSPNSLTIVAKK
jgi:2-polyprenyl-3-methyl-5-hydroxy-6-metoxy-1,4-benzoquinol methylase